MNIFKNKLRYIKSDVAEISVQLSASELVSTKTVLVVEDDICCLMSLQLMLQYYGCKVLSANVCSQALALLRNNHKNIDLILLDIMMPDKTGIDFLIESRTENILRDIPVIIQSVEGNETIQKALDKGASGYIHKPYIKEEISSIITHLTKGNVFAHFNVKGVSA
jgi:two-component system chemotaxis sensor kinase CheA